MWKIVVFFVTGLTLLCKADKPDIKESEACYGNEAAAGCIRHNLRCFNHTVIGLTSVNFEKKDKLHCASGVNNCQDKSCCSKGGAGYLFNLTMSDLSKLYSDCSGKERCSYRMPNRVSSKATTFSDLQYMCFQESGIVNLSAGIKAKNGTDLSIFHQSKGAKPQLQVMNNIRCIVNHLGSSVSVYALDFRLENRPSPDCSTLKIVTNSLHTFTCSDQLTPYQILATSNADPLELIFEMNPKRRQETVWIHLKSSTEFRVECSYGGQSTDAVRGTTHVTSSQETHGGESEGQVGMEPNTGAIVGGVIAALLVIVLVVLVLLWMRYKRSRGLKSKLPTPETANDDNTAASPKPNHNYHDQTKTTKTFSDYATLDDKSISPGPAGYEVAFSSTNPGSGKILSENEDDYDHVADKDKPTAAGTVSAGYDTTASVAAFLQNFRNDGVADIDDYGYNHIAKNPNSKHLTEDYDTTTSASKACSRLDESRTEDYYDHFHHKSKEVKTSDSPYDTAGHSASPGDYSVADKTQNQDPYDLAK